MARVGYELNRIESFDDVVVTYHHPIPDERGDLVAADYHQVKFHVNQAGAFTHEALVDPAFINATSVSLLQRLRAAQLVFAPNGGARRFIIASPWIIHPDDPLSELVSNQGGELRLRVLFDGTGLNSRMGRVRKLWREHLNLKRDDELAEVLRPLRIEKDAANLKNLNEILNLSLQIAGFIPVDAGQLVHPYDDLAKKLLAQGRNEFTREELQRIGERENLWRGQPASVEDSTPIGIRSFMRWAEHMEDETEEMLDLVRHFDNRHVRDQELWRSTIFQLCPKSHLTVVDFFLPLLYKAGRRLFGQSHVNYYTREVREEWENSAIGILLCAEKNEAVVRYTLPEGEPRIFASRYHLYLPSEQELAEELSREREMLALKGKIESNEESYNYSRNGQGKIRLIFVLSKDERLTTEYKLDFAQSIYGHIPCQKTDYSSIALVESFVNFYILRSGFQQGKR